MVLTSITLSSHMAETFYEAGVPVVLFNRRLDDPNVHAVACDNVGGGRLVADALLDAGHKRFAFVGGHPDTSTNQDRKAGFSAGLRARGAGLAAWLAAEPQLSDLGMGLARPSLRDEIARRGIAAFAQERAGRAAVPRPLGVILFPGAGAGLLLRTLAAGGALPAPPSEFARRAALLRLALTGRWCVGR